MKQFLKERTFIIFLLFNVVMCVITYFIVSDLRHQRMRQMYEEKKFCINMFIEALDRPENGREDIIRNVELLKDFVLKVDSQRGIYAQVLSEGLKPLTSHVYNYKGPKFDLETTGIVNYISGEIPEGEITAVLGPDESMESYFYYRWYPVNVKGYDKICLVFGVTEFAIPWVCSTGLTAVWLAALLLSVGVFTCLFICVEGARNDCNK